MNLMVECQYLDYKIVEDPVALAKKSEELPQNQNILHTCHRIEFYGDPSRNRPALFQTPPTVTIKDLPKVLERLASISVGIESQIIAEWAIEHQVKGFVDGLQNDDKTKDLGQSALDISKSLRAEFEFYAPDHAELALSNVRIQTKSRILLVFGASMLAEKLAARHKQLGYSEMLVVTRNRKKAKKRIRGLDAQKITTLDNLYTSGELMEPCDILIASTDINEEYAEQIRGFIHGRSGNTVVDVSAKPIFSEGDGAITLSTETMGQFITEHNEKMMKKAEIIKERVCSSSSKAAEQLKQKWKF